MTPHNRPFGAADGMRYGLLGLPLAFVALPLYVVVPHHYASTFGIPLALLGAVLLAARLLDALVDPLIGRGVDRLYARSIRAVLALGGAAACLLALGFYLLFFPPVREVPSLMAWLAATLAVTYLAFSVLTVAHQSWGAMLGGDEAQRARIVGWREGLGVVGVLVASVAPATLGLTATAVLFAVLLAVGWVAWARSLRPQAQATTTEASALWLPLRRPAFRRLLTVFMLNGIASAVPATLVLFFVQDRLQAPRSWEPAFLGLYFLCAALSIPLWLRGVRRWGLARSWLAGMGLAIAAFVWTAGLGAGDAPMFLLVCAASGLALGADLALPGALLAGLIQDAGDRGRHEGAYFGWWNFATKLNLALAAGLALPLLGLAGYAPGARDAQALSALTFAYGVLPCVLKLLAAAGLYVTLIRPDTATSKVTP
ncbi:MAG: putative Na+/melibiose symporter [Pseudomonadota bacterium]|jgi:Na+/melibiose symporter-like transporter